MVDPVVENTPQTTWRGLFLRLVCKFCAIKKIVHSRLPRKTTHLPQTKNSKIGTRQSYWKARWISGPLVSVQNDTKVAKKQKRSYFKVLDAKCKGIDGAIVEVWYAGGVPGFQKNLSTEGSTLWSCHHSLPLVRLVNYSHITSLSCFVRWDGVQFPSESLTTERSALWPCHPLCWIHLVT